MSLLDRVFRDPALRRLHQPPPEQRPGHIPFESSARRQERSWGRRRRARAAGVAPPGPARRRHLSARQKVNRARRANVRRMLGKAPH